MRPPLHLCFLNKNPTIRFLTPKNFNMFITICGLFEAHFTKWHCIGNPKWFKLRNLTLCPCDRLHQYWSIMCTVHHACMDFRYIKPLWFVWIVLLPSSTVHVHVLCNYTFCLQMQVPNWIHVSTCTLIVMLILNISGNFINLPKWD